MKQDFSFDVTYDETTYKAMADASWQMFRKEHMVKKVYPMFEIMLFLIIMSMIGNWNQVDNFIKIICISFAVFLIACFPLTKVTSKWRMKHDAIKKLKKEGNFPMNIKFAFTNSTIYSEVKGQGSIVRYTDATEFVALGKWRIIFFGQAGYIFHESDFKSPEDVARFENFVAVRTGFKPMLLKGSGPSK